MYEKALRHPSHPSDRPYSYVRGSFSAKGRESDKVRKMYTDKSSYTEYKWVQQIFYLEKGKTIEVALMDSSLVGNKEP